MLIGVSLFLSEIIAYSLKRYTKIEWRVRRRTVKRVFMATENCLSESFRMENTSHASTALAFINIDFNPREYLVFDFVGLSLAPGERARG